MRSFIFRRLVLAALVCLTVLVVSFILTRLSGDLAASIAGPNASAADIAIITKNYGLDRPLVVQFFDWAGHAAEGDFGRSFLYHVPVWGLIRDRLPVTLILGLTGLSIALLVALPLGILMGSFEAVNRFFDPIVAPLRYLPITAFIPLLILWFGIYEKEKIVFLFLGTFVFLLPVVVDAMA